CPACRIFVSLRFPHFATRCPSIPQTRERTPRQGLYTRAPEAHRGSRGPSPHDRLDASGEVIRESTEGWRKLAGSESAAQPQPEPDPRAEERPPGQFVSDDL